MADKEIKASWAPESFTFGDGIDWASPLTETHLYVELPFWLMTPPGRVDVQWCGTAFTIDICSPWVEVFRGLVTDSRTTRLYCGPWNKFRLPGQIVADLARQQVPLMRRQCKTVLRLKARAHLGAFRQLSDADLPRMKREQEAYWASLCDAHLPVVNELIQRYRLMTYDYFAYEVSAWDVPIWAVHGAEVVNRAVLLPYKSWDQKPVIQEQGESPSDQPNIRQVEYTTTAELSAASSEGATPGEFDLLDARSLMERGDYTGAVRRTVTAIEAVLAWALFGQLAKKHDASEAARRVQCTDGDFPGRLRQWRRLAQPQISEQEFEEFETTRKVRHEIVHRGLRLVHLDRGRAQRAVDTGRWLYNKIESKPVRTSLRDKGVIKSVGRSALVPWFSATVSADGITLKPF